ncbi:uncharacterized protein [Palaemon carinicauda]|uniref:uncharacterized protein n=1 Tax=Palaemon carinicauda TaxID=392227 RepID=UPI0035B5A5D4
MDQVNVGLMNGGPNESNFGSPEAMLNNSDTKVSILNPKDLDCLRPVRADDDRQSTRNRLWKWSCIQTLKDTCNVKGKEEKVQAVTFTPGVSNKPTPAPPVCGCRFLDQHYEVGEVRKSSCHTCRCQRSGTFTCMSHGNLLSLERNFEI